ncbi:MAG: CxxxxCH/CxxCH domain-containing protein [Deltaproteobacteria bacterium]|nr:CxxxxCH/CxxCH domain-containing protein [Deltaproteobacteria bacterium]
MKKKMFGRILPFALLLAPLAAGADMSPHNAANLLDSFRVDFPDGTFFSKGDCSNCHGANYTARCDRCHTNTSGGGYGDMRGWDKGHDYVTDSGPAMTTHRNLSCGDCHIPVTHDTLNNIVNHKLVTGTFAGVSVVNTLMSTETWNPDPERWVDTNGDPALGVVQEQWTSTITISAGYAVLSPDWTDPGAWMEKTGPERGLILGIISSSNVFDDDAGTFEVLDAAANGDGTVTLTVKGKIVLASLYQVDQANPAFALYYYQMLKPFIGYCDDPDQPGDQIDMTDPQLCFDLMGGNLYGSSNCPVEVKCIRQNVIFAGPADFAGNDGLGAGGNDSTPDGICQACHLNTSHWRRDGSLGDHYSGQKCTDCHDHKKGFAPDCTLCHAGPPVDMAGMVSSTDGVSSTPNATGSVTAGAHALHATSAGYNYSCAQCHAGGMPDSSYTGNNRIQIGFAIDPTGTAASYDGQAALVAPFAYEGSNGTTVTTGGTMVCANVYCHSNGAAVSTDRINSSSSPAWNSSGPLSCSSCHPYPMSYGADDPRKDTHGRHIQAGYGNCSLCHFATTADGAIISDRSRHANRVYDVSPAPTFAGRPVDGNVPLAFTYSFAKGGGSCASNSCHAYWGYSDPARWGVNTDLVVTPYVSALHAADADRTITFDASRSSCYENVNGTAEERECSYEWDFGGSGSVQGGNGTDMVVFRYDAEGTYTASLTMRESVTGKTGSTGITATAANVVPPPASADFATAVNGATVTLSATLPANVVRLYVYWGDRLRTVYTSPATDVMTHTYGRGGRSYNIRVTVMDSTHNSVDYTFSEDADLTVVLP